MSPTTSLLVSLLLLILNAFFVGGEFAVVAAKRHRLEERAANGSRAARAAVNADRELSLMLAGAQLGITACTLGLGALAEPAVATLLTPLFEMTGLNYYVSHLIALIIAVALVVFLHMVVGEMAPKSWAISHPETSAVLLALPFRGFTWVARPLLWVLNEFANLLVRMVGVTPVDSVSSSRGPADLQMLLMQSKEHGVIADADHQMLSGALALEAGRVTDVMFTPDDAVTIRSSATVAQVEERCRESGRSRLFTTDADGRIDGLIHVRDAVRASARGEREASAQSLSQPLSTVPGHLPLIDAVGHLRSLRAQLVLVTNEQGHTVGLTSMEDLLEQILGDFNDETDTDDTSETAGTDAASATAAASFKAPHPQ